MLVGRQEWNAQAVANVTNALAKADMRQTVLLDKLADICEGMTASDLNGQAVSSIIKAYAKLQHKCPKLLRHLANTIVLMPLATFQPQAIANIVDAFMRFKSDLKECKTDERVMDARVMDVFRRMSHAAQSNAPCAFRGQSISVILNAYVRTGLIDEELFAFMSRSIQRLPASMLAAEHIALITNAFAKAEIFDEELLSYMSRVTRVTPHVGESEVHPSPSTASFRTRMHACLNKH
jgi:hypothetical protein